jgi:hypothetical protein
MSDLRTSRALPSTGCEGIEIPNDDEGMLALDAYEFAYDNGH